jgi:hypothetical protein
VKKRIHGRINPSMVVAIVALVMAMGGSAIAATTILVDNPDQLGTAVVTAPKIATSAVNNSKISDGTIRHNDLRDPVLRVHVADNVLVGKSDASLSSYLGRGNYRITFDPANFVGISDFSQCTMVAQATTVGNFDQPIFARAAPAGGFNVSVQTNIGQPTSVFDPATGGTRSILSSVPTDADFSLVVAC